MRHGLESMHGALADAGLIGSDKGEELHEVPRNLLLDGMESSSMFSLHPSLLLYGSQQNGGKSRNMACGHFLARYLSDRVISSSYSIT